jgi:hypothetical protein
VPRARQNARRRLDSQSKTILVDRCHPDPICGRLKNGGVPMPLNKYLGVPCPYPGPTTLNARFSLLRDQKLPGMVIGDRCPRCSALVDEPLTARDLAVTAVAQTLFYATITGWQVP